MSAFPRPIRVCLALLTAAALVWSVSAQAAAKKAAKSSSSKSSAKKNPTSKATASKSPAKKSARRVSSRRRRGKQSYRARLARQKLQPQRIEEIQQGLIQAGYLNEEPNGKWDNSTREAMRSFQHAHGFPETGLPEAKSLMKLGLGPHPLPEDLDPSARASTSPQALAAPGESSPTSDGAAR